MENSIFIKSIIVALFSLTLTACPPYGDKKDQANQQVSQTGADISALNQQLSKTSTGRQTLNTMNDLVSKGYAIQIYQASQTDIQNMNGHSGGGYKISNNTISLYINNTLSNEEQAHAVAHEISHVNDDLDIDGFLIQYPHVKSAAEDFVSRYRTVSISSFDQRVVSYVLGTLFCSEMRAYTTNQQLASEGLPTSNFAKGSGLAQFIDQNYIYRFGTQYGSNASAMGSWCLSQSSMRNIQYNLIW